MDNISEYSAIAIIVIFLIKEVFAFARTRNNKKNGKDINGQIGMLNVKMDNHLVALEERLRMLEKEMIDIKENIREIKSDILNLKFREK